MYENWSNLDLKNLLKTIDSSIRKFGGFNPETVRRRAFKTQDSTRWDVLRALSTEPSTGIQLIETLSQKSSVTASEIYPLLDQLCDEGLVSQSTKKERKFYSITDAGKSFLNENEESQSIDSEDEAEPWETPKWIDLRGLVPTAFARLSKVGLEVAKFGSKEQQEAAAKEIDEARKRIHRILADG